MTDNGIACSTNTDKRNMKAGLQQWIDLEMTGDLIPIPPPTPHHWNQLTLLESTNSIGITITELESILSGLIKRRDTHLLTGGPVQTGRAAPYGQAVVMESRVRGREVG